ncbi:MAG TPA: gamma carbonic anhydrase family protein [Elusimicrobiales bacterium]|nr:gamma carbonic anhydrase family protein [Elusimicrobiales bacterium]
MLYKLKDCEPQVPASAYVHESSVVIGRVKLGERVSLWPMCVLRADIDSIEVGDDTNIQDCAVVHVNEKAPVKLGKGLTVGHGAVIHGSVIGDYTLVGMKAVVLESTIGENCLIAAGSLIPAGKTIAPRSLVMGSPGKVVRQLTDEEVEKLRWSNKVYLDIADMFKKDCSRIG